MTIEARGDPSVAAARSAETSLLHGSGRGAVALAPCAMAAPEKRLCAPAGRVIEPQASLATRPPSDQSTNKGGRKAEKAPIKEKGLPLPRRLVERVGEPHKAHELVAGLLDQGTVLAGVE